MVQVHYFILFLRVGIQLAMSRCDRGVSSSHQSVFPNHFVNEPTIMCQGTFPDNGPGHGPLHSLPTGCHLLIDMDDAFSEENVLPW